MKPVKLWVDENPPPAGEKWLHITNFDSFSNILNTLRFEEISLISFGTNLEDEGDLELQYNTEDCAVDLVERGRGRELPRCSNHTNYLPVQNVINKYAASYKHNGYCSKIQL